MKQAEQAALLRAKDAAAGQGAAVADPAIEDPGATHDEPRTSRTPIVAN